MAMDRHWNWKKALGADLVLFLAFGCLGVNGREVLQIDWASKITANPPRLEAAAEQWLPAFRMAISTLPEAVTVPLVLSQPALIGLGENQARELVPLVTRRYELMTADTAFVDVQSALPYCFSAERPARGLATVYVPDHLNSDVEVVVFLHGYGGSFLWYIHYLAEAFPEWLIVCPSFGITGAGMTKAYLDEALAATQSRLQWQGTSRPRLIGLSAGGFAACHIYAGKPDDFASLAILAAYPPPETVPKLLSRRQVRFLAGDLEPFTSSGLWKNAMTGDKTPVANRAEFSLVHRAGHFFMLTHPTETIAWLKKR